MRPRRLAPAAVLLAALVLALAACTGGAPPPAAPPTAIATPEAASPPAPTAIATPGAPPPPAPTAIATPEAPPPPAPTAIATPEAPPPPAPTAIATPEAPPPPAPTAIATPEAPPPPAPTAIATPEAPPPPAPTAIATPEAPPPPAPTAIATPEAPPPPAPAPTPEQACANGVAVENPEERPGLVADCVALLASRDALRGEAALDWSADLAIEGWEGVAVEGEPPRVTGLDLRGKGLTGSIPLSIGRLRLDEVLLADNDLTGCIPSPLEDVGFRQTISADIPLTPWNNDLAELGLPWCLRYDALDATGAVASAGSWAILDAGGDMGVSGQAEVPPAVITTWEGLRFEAATLRVHQTDAGGTSWAAEFGAVSEGDLFEWWGAIDCWVLYRVVGDPIHPASSSGHWEFPVERLAYSGIGHLDCFNDVSPTVIRMDVGAPGVYTTVTGVPILYGPYLIAPGYRSYDYQSMIVEYEPPSRQRDFFTTDLAEAKQLAPYWRDPDLPARWTFVHAGSGGGVSYPDHGYCAGYIDDKGSIDICVSFVERRPMYRQAVLGDDSVINETRLIDGYPAFLRYSLLVPDHRKWPIIAAIYDPDTGIQYYVKGTYASMRGDVDAVIAIARSLLPD